MWVVISLLLFGAVAQPGYPPCGLLGESFSDLAVTWTPEVPSLQSQVTFNVTGLVLGYTGSLQAVMALYSADTIFYFSAFCQDKNSQVADEQTFNFTCSYFLPGSMVMPCGIYQYHIYIYNEVFDQLCLQEYSGNITIGTTMPFVIVDYAWTPVSILSENPATLLINGRNGPEEPLNLKECQLEILTNPSQLLDLVTCEVSGVETGAPFQVISAPIKFPALAGGNYTVRVHFYDEEELGYVEIALEVTGDSPLFLYNSTYYMCITNEGSEVITINEIFALEYTDASSIVTIPMYINGPITLQPINGSYCFDYTDLMFIVTNASSASVFIGVIDENNVCVGQWPYFSLYIGNTEITSLEVLQTAIGYDDIFIVEVEGCELQYVMWQLMNNTYSVDESAVAINIFANSQKTITAILLADFPDILYVPGDYLLCAIPGQNYPIYLPVTLTNSEPALIESVFNLNYTEQLTAGGVVQFYGYSMFFMPSLNSCDLTLTNGTFDINLGEVYCTIGFDWCTTDGVCTLVLWMPVLPLPEQLYNVVAGPYALQVDNVNSSGSFLLARGAVYLNISDQYVTPLTFSVLPSAIYVNDILAVTFEGQASAHFENITLQSTSLYDYSSRSNLLNPELSKSTLTWQGDVFQFNASLTFEWPASTEASELGLCFEAISLGVYCLRTYVTLVQGYRLNIYDFMWSHITSDVVTFNFSASSLVPGVFCQDLCKVTLYSGAMLVSSETVACEAGVMSAWETTRVTSGPLSLPAHYSRSDYNVSIQFLSSTGLLNGEIATTLRSSSGALYLGFWLLLS